MRLIDADEFKRQIAGMAIINNYPADKANKLCELVDIQPTAYDVDKVLERLKEKSELAYRRYMDCPSSSPCCVRYQTQYQERKMCLEIVTEGGVNE